MPRRTDIPVQQLRLVLMKSDYRRDQAILPEIGRLRSFELAQGLPFKGILYVRPRRAAPPKWLFFVQPHLVGDLRGLLTASSAAVLLLTAANRRFALLFGYGRSLLDPRCWVRDFGLKVVLNTVDPKELRSIDTRTFEELTLQTRRQASRGTELESFGLDVSQDLVRQVAGVPRDASLARRVAGSDGLFVATPIPFRDLAAKCRQLLKAYQATSYKKHFAFVDRVRPERDPIILEELDEKLLAALADPAATLHMAPPEPFDWENVEFTYSAARDAQGFEDLTIRDYLASVRDLDRLTTEGLKRTRVRVRQLDTESSQPRWSVYDCMVFETSKHDRLYVLSCGDWYLVETSFVRGVDRAVLELAACSLRLPPFQSGDSEASYNARAGGLGGVVSLDRECARVDGSPIEPCDLFTAARQFVHVKRRSRSSTLSHLFSQGLVSAECFLSDQTFRREMKKAVKEVNRTLARLIPEGRPTSSKYKVVYAIVDRERPNWCLSLPFFSRLNLKNARERLQRFGYQVGLTRISTT